jgi:hypothetical protein
MKLSQVKIEDKINRLYEKIQKHREEEKREFLEIINNNND